MNKKLPQIFVSHSKHDKDIRSSFDTIFARTGVKSVCMEFEEMFSPEWATIRDAIHDSETVFLLLGPNITKSKFTNNWIAFEVGLSCAFDKRVWVFEEMNAKIDFPIPYVTDYFMYSLSDNIHFDYVKAIIQAYGENANSLIPVAEVPEGFIVRCPHCGSAYALHQTVGPHYCPLCRKPSWKQK